MARRHSAARVRLAIALLLGLAVAALLLASPRHRQLYSRLFPGSPEALAPPGLAPSPPPAPPTPTAGAPRERSTPLAPRRGLADRTNGEPPSGPGDRVVVRVADTPPIKLPSVGLPTGWNLKEFAGRAQVEVVSDDSRISFRLVSHGTSFALYRGVVLDVKQFPILMWWWKVLALPAGGDMRQRATDDQAAQVYLVFPRWPAPRINSDVVGYIWDSRAPVGATLTSSQSDNVRVIVLQSGADRLGQWVREERNVYRDYVELFGREPPRIGQVALMVDSNETRSHAEALITDLTFLRKHGASLRRRGRGVIPKP